MSEQNIVKMTRPRSAETQLWTVDAIVEHRVELINNVKIIYYKIRWAPDGSYPDSWEPAENCLNCESAVVIYWEARAFERYDLDNWP